RQMTSPAARVIADEAWARLLWAGPETPSGRLRQRGLLLPLIRLDENDCVQRLHQAWGRDEPGAKFVPPYSPNRGLAHAPRRWRPVAFIARPDWRRLAGG